MTAAEATTIVAMLERAEGNESIGTMWIDAAVFPATAPLSDVIRWAEEAAKTFDGDPRGRLMLRRASDHRSA